MRTVVFDASVILALLFREPLAQDVTALLPYAVVSTVNLVEVMSRLVKDGVAADRAWHLSRSVVSDAVAFDLQQSELSGHLRIATQHAGLSLGDRCCLALALSMQAAVYTTDRAWGGLDVGVLIHVLR